MVAKEPLTTTIFLLLGLGIRHGEAVGIIGPSGTGKSTVLKIIAGLLAPDKIVSVGQGEVLIRGRRRHGLISDQEISGLRIGLVFQSAALFDSLTVRENVGFLLYENSSMPEDQIHELVTESLAAVGLKGVEERLPSELSGGMKKRVALARSIIFDTTKDAIEPEVRVFLRILVDLGFYNQKHPLISSAWLFGIH
uniref:AAA+ ATPase domain-containing protein n=1 Tax=Vitis vinifera TaxID=29760 RepID=A5ALW3_VITVI|nr:hypothetical protein VITISV_000808 [Vitis vinifera]